MAVVRMEIVVPARIAELLDKAEKQTGIRKEDLIIRAIVNVIEEFGVGVG